jgi:hypothetical protein
MRQRFTTSVSPDRKYFVLRVHDLNACTETKIQNHIYAALHQYLRSLKQQPEETNGNYTQTRLQS